MYRAAALAIALTLACAAAAQEGKMDFIHGFRYDPMKFVEQSDTVQAALVRRHVFKTPKPSDGAVLKKRIDAILAKQKPDGLLEDDVKGTAGRMLELIELGVDPKRPEVKKVIDVLLKERTDEHGDNHKHISVRATRALCLLGITDPPEVKVSARTMVEREKVWNGQWKLCPWGTQLYLDSLWDCRSLAETTPLVTRVLARVADQMNDAGTLTYKDPWAFVNCAGRIDLPEAKRVVARLVPMALRAQKPDGGWGDHSFVAFRALVNHGFFEPLRKLPPLPADWTVARTFATPKGTLRHLVWDGVRRRLWTLDTKAKQAIALSPADGSVQKRIAIPFEEAVAVGWWDNALGVVQAEPKRLVQFNPKTGAVLREISLAKYEWPQGFVQMGETLWLYDAFLGCILKVDPGQPDKREFHGHTGGGCHITRVGDSIWCVQDFVPLMLRTSTDGKLLDWAETPFPGRCHGVAWGGAQLWALDDGRLCAIERAKQ